MSVINKMLRDLDQRGADSSTIAAAPVASVLRDGTASLPGYRVPHRATRNIPWRSTYQVLSGVAVVVTVVVGVWQMGGFDSLQLGFRPEADLPVAVPLPVAEPVTAPLAAPVVVDAVPMTETSSKSVPVIAPITPSLARLPTPEKTLAGPSALPRSTVPTAQPNLPPKINEGVPSGRVAAAVVVPASAPVVTPASSPGNPVPDPSQLAQRQLQAGRDAMSQAQMLWSTGTRDAAIDVLQQSVAVLERSSASSSTPAHTRLLISMIRELTRLQLADGRVEDAWALLVRLESRMSNDPDLWAFRGHTAQRLGRHQDSVLAYTAALQSRPNEQRWLLGAVVSYTALGQMARATEFLDKARGLGPVNREVQNYLKQMGLPIQDE